MTRSIAEAIALGTRHHQAGQLAEAERLYRQVLAAEPDNCDALHYLGVLAMQGGQFAAAVELIGRAVRVDRMQPAFHANLGEAHRHLGALTEAVKCFQTALRLAPDLAPLHTMLAGAQVAQGKLPEAAAALREALRLRPEDVQARTQLGNVLLDLGKPAEAETCFRRVVRSDPRNALWHVQLAGALHAQGKLAEAAACYRDALAIDASLADAHNNLGAILKEQGHLDEAIDHFRTALRLRPGHAAAYTNLGLAYDALERCDEAADCYREAAQADPRSAIPRYNLGAMLQRLGQLDAALAWYEAALQADPKHGPSHAAIGHLLQEQGKLNAAIAACQRALQVDPNNAEACNNLGAAWSEQGRRDEAIGAFERAIALRPDFAIAHGNLAVALQSLGRLDDAIAAHRKAVELAPGNAGLHSNLLYALNYHPRYDAAALFQEHRAWGQRHADPLTPANPAHANDRTPDRRLRVGYVSPYFLAHAVNFFVEPILAAHDRREVEVFCYADVREADETTARLMEHAAGWRSTVNLTDRQLFDRVREDKIDLLVDLTGHIGGGRRMLVFARKAAPVQVTYIGYQNTTGMLAMDYRLTDSYSDPPGLTDGYHTEELVRLPTTFFCYQPSNDAPALSALPALAAGQVTFGSFNNFAKITFDVLDAWGAIMEAVPRSKLMLLGDMTESLQARLCGIFAGRGIAAERLELVNRVPRSGYLDLIRRVDVALDPFPFNGHTTTCDCLWQGVPVVTLSGHRYASRFGGSGLVTLGLDELVAQTTAQYIEIAVRLAANLDRLVELRGTLRERMAASPLLDFATFTRNLEAEYHRMWARWCAE